MKISTNFAQFPELKLDEQQVKNCIRKHFGTIKAPIYLYIDPKLKTSHGLHACRNITHYMRLPEATLTKEARKNKNHFHKISLSHTHLTEAKSSATKKTVECKGWKFPEWPRTHRFYHSYLMTLLSHELQHARQVEHGIQYKRHNWLGYDKLINDKEPTEYDACMAEFKKADKMLRSYCER
jgi:hypothetical protein